MRALSAHKITPLAVAELTVLLDIAPTAIMLPKVTTCAVDPSTATPLKTLVAPMLDDELADIVDMPCLTNKAEVDCALPTEIVELPASNAEPDTCVLEPADTADAPCNILNPEVLSDALALEVLAPW